MSINPTNSVALPHKQWNWSAANRLKIFPPPARLRHVKNFTIKLVIESYKSTNRQIRELPYQSP